MGLFNDINSAVVNSWVYCCIFKFSKFNITGLKGPPVLTYFFENISTFSFSSSLGSSSVNNLFLVSGSGSVMNWFKNVLSIFISSGSDAKSALYKIKLVYVLIFLFIYLYFETYILKVS